VAAWQSALGCWYTQLTQVSNKGLGSVAVGPGLWLKVAKPLVDTPAGVDNPCQSAGSPHSLLTHAPDLCMHLLANIAHDSTHQVLWLLLVPLTQLHPLGQVIHWTYCAPTVAACRDEIAALLTARVVVPDG
jgi:hypothetical protein